MTAENVSQMMNNLHTAWFKLCQLKQYMKMTTPKEKAKQLVSKFRKDAFQGVGFYHNERCAQRLALICVEEILESSPWGPTEFDFHRSVDNTIKEAAKYWEKVKK